MAVVHKLFVVAETQFEEMPRFAAVTAAYESPAKCEAAGRALDGAEFFCLRGELFSAGLVSTDMGVLMGIAAIGLILIWATYLRKPADQSEGQLRKALTALYDAGHWRCDRAVEEDRLWEQARKALGRQKGSEPKPISAG